ncbi:hypothetical protein HKCCE3408_07340 [Rhodobacterales bacterium HKCCE3408]|nr:hypothetical protein [Rhodobacterales bacterium HKCCE3408]
MKFKDGILGDLPAEEIGRLVEDESAQSYATQYGALLRLAADCHASRNYDGLALAVFGWMPTILKKTEFSGYDFDSIRSTTCFDRTEFEKWTSGTAAVNGSWVGTSKFLHFLNPDVFPVWDQNLHKAVTDTKAQYWWRSISIYSDWTALCHEKLTREPQGLKNFRKFLSQKANCEISRLRALEFMVFLRSKSLSGNKQEKSQP